MQLQLHDYQKRAILFGLNQKASYMAVDLGLGKTAIALRWIRALKSKWTNPTIVFAPLRVCYTTWPDEIKKWTPELKYQILHGPYKDEKFNYKSDIYLVNYEGIKWLSNKLTTAKRKWRKCHVVIDEGSLVKSPSTKRFKMLRKMSALWTTYRMVLSATPAPNGYHDLWSQYYLLTNGATLGRRYSTYRDRFFFYSGPPRYQTAIVPGSTREILRLIKPCTFRLEADDYLKLPEYIHNEIKVQLPSKIMDEYKTLERDFIIELKNAEVAAFSAGALSMKLRQFVQGGVYYGNDMSGGKNFERLHTTKINALQELVESACGQPILVPIQFRFEYIMLTEAFKGRKLPIIAGGTSAAKSIEYVKEWNKGNIPILLCHPASIGHGLNLQAAGHIICWLGLTWSLEQYKQLIGRIYRQGQKHAVTIHHIIAENTIDQKVLKILKKKNSTQQELLDALKET